MWVRCCLCLKEIDAVTCNQSQVGAQLSSDSVLCVGCVLRPEALPALLAQPACPKKRKLTKDPDLAPYTSGTLATSSMTRNEEEYYSRGFQQGFLAGEPCVVMWVTEWHWLFAGMNRIQTCATGSLHGPGTMRQDAIQQVYGGCVFIIFSSKLLAFNAGACKQCACIKHPHSASLQA